MVTDNCNNKKRSHTQLDSRKQVIAFQDRVMTINIKEAQHSLKREKQIEDFMFSTFCNYVKVFIGFDICAKLSDMKYM